MIQQAHYARYVVIRAFKQSAYNTKCHEGVREVDSYARYARACCPNAMRGCVAVYGDREDDTRTRANVAVALRERAASCRSFLLHLRQRRFRLRR